MTKPTLTVVGRGEIEPDTETTEMVARATERMLAAAKDPEGLFWVITVVDGDVSVAFHGGRLESSVVAEMVATDMKRDAVGL